jgi:hypothetical protein
VDSRCSARAALPEQYSDKREEKLSTGKRRVYGFKK